jgi:small redox-active disulfide protein 2
VGKPQIDLNDGAEENKSKSPVIGDSDKEENVMKVEILGVGCAKCTKLYDAVTELVKKNGIEAEVVKVEDLKVFGQYGVFMTPALVVDGEVKVAGKVPKDAEILKWLSS